MAAVVSAAIAPLVVGGVFGVPAAPRSVKVVSGVDWYLSSPFELDPL